MVRAMYRPVRSGWLALLVGLLAVAPAPAQTRSTTIPTLQPPQEDTQALSVTDTNVGIIDPALPMNMMRVRVDGGWHDPRPFRSEYFFGKPGFLGGHGQPLAETNVAYQEAMLYGEYALFPFFSTFGEVPYVWLNPDINANQHGIGDTNFGIKLCTWSSDNIIATIQLRVYNPAGGTLGTTHWTFEPGLLASYKITDQLLLEGQGRYWMPLNDDSFSGDVANYGLGLSYGQRNDAFWYIPVVEGVGWTALNGQSVVASSATNFFVESARNQTVGNGYLGVRLGWGPHIEGYLGYGRCFTGNTWSRDFARFEFRLRY